jgi:glyoxylase-like metal-dependent hydrolase (beta-lactamase superfamily II)
VKNISYEFELDKFKCMAISDGRIPEEHGGVSITCLLVRTGENVVLIDTGEGPKFNPTTGKLLENMKASEVKPEEIDTVVNTHAHVDHVGGNTDLDGKPNYPNARYFIYNKEWDYWLGRIKLKPGEENPNETQHIPVVRRAFTSIQDRFIPWGEDKDIVPGIRFTAMPGHTPGNAIVVVTSGKKQLLAVGDLLHEVAEFTKPDLWSYWDTFPEEATRNRATVIARAVETHALVFCTHLTFPGLGYIVKKGGTLDWEPFHK